MKSADKERVLVEVVQRVVDRVGADPARVEEAIFSTLYEERRRLETEPDADAAREQEAYYEHIQAQALRASPQRQRALLQELVRRFVEEVAGHFDPRVYALATRLVPPGLSVLLNALSPMKLIDSLPSGFSELDQQLEIQGEIASVKKAAELGTLVVVPTHSSNLDSILMGFTFFRLGLPPHLYGAGLNLFSNKLIGFFMHNLGAYKVDRRKKADVYKDVLKTYAGYALEIGYHSLFFPGGTRSRSGAVESRLKLGLLGTGLQAYTNNLIGQRPKPDVFVVPCTINYELVLEAETLIDDFLKEAGRSRYIIDDDEFSRPKRVLDFIKRLFSLESKIHLVFGQPLDPFGNRVGPDGQSLDPRGRVVDRQRYILRNGIPFVDRQRDEQYTQELATSIVQSFRQNTVIKPTNVISKVVFDWLKERTPNLDLFKMLRLGGPDDSLPLVEVYARTERLVERLRRLERDNKLRLDPVVVESDPPMLVNHALIHLGTYHRRPALERRGDRLFHNDRKLLFFYQNRLYGFDLAQAGGPS